MSEQPEVYDGLGDVWMTRHSDGTVTLDRLATQTLIDLEFIKHVDPAYVRADMEEGIVELRASNVEVSYSIDRLDELHTRLECTLVDVRAV